MRSTPGRKRDLSYRERLDVALSWGERRNARKGRGSRLALDREVADALGTTPRMVRRCRSELRAFLPHPAWKEREHEARGRVDFAARELAKRLMTPERQAKREPVEIRSGALWVDAKDSGPQGETIHGPAPPGARCIYLATVRMRVTDSRARQAAYRRVMAEQGILVKEQ